MSVGLIVKDSFMNCLYLLVSRYQIVFYPFSDFYITDVVFQFDIFFFRIVQFSRYKMVGLGRLELPTSRLSGVRSNLLSYRPKIACCFGHTYIYILFFLRQLKFLFLEFDSWLD